MNVLILNLCVHDLSLVSISCESAGPSYMRSWVGRIQHNHRFVLRVRFTTVSRRNDIEIGLVFTCAISLRQ